jgi:hypothetical protein
LNSARYHLASFAGELRSNGQSELAIAAARECVKVSDRFVDEFENKTTVADANKLRAVNHNFIHFDLNPIVDVLPSDELHEFVGRQQLFFGRCYGFVAQHFSSSDDPRQLFDIALATLGRAPKSLGRFSVLQHCDLINRCLTAGNKAEALRVFDFACAEAMKQKQLSYVSGSYGGRVVNGATQQRYAIAKLDPHLGRVAAGTQIIDQIKYEGARIDGYRLLGESYAATTDQPTAMAWAESVTDRNLQLAAYVGILIAAAQDLDAEPSDIENRLNELRRYGQPLWIYGC